MPASFITLPPELMSMIIPDPCIPIDVEPPQYGEPQQRWLPTKLKWVDHDRYTRDGQYEADVDCEEKIGTLRSLSSTCTTLRHLALPRLWAVVEVKSVLELDVLYEALRITPSVALHIRQLTILRSDASKSALNPWLNKRRCLEGRPAIATSEVEREGSDAYFNSWADFYSYFDKALAEIVSQLSSLEAFAWHDDEKSLSLKAFEALEHLPALRFVHLEVIRIESDLLMMGGRTLVPLWRLVPTLTAFSIGVSNHRDMDFTALIEELDTFELPQEEIPDGRGLDTMLLSMLYRTIIAAAQGKVKRLHLGSAHPITPLFAVPELMPHWLNVDCWGCTQGYDYRAAASTFREIIAHASLWLGTSLDTVERQDRKLTRQDVQSLYSQFRVKAPWDMPHATWMSVADLFSDSHPPEMRYYERPHIDLYLPLLERDPELAQRVADKWNEIVQRGEADIVKCRCDNCQAVI